MSVREPLQEDARGATREINMSLTGGDLVNDQSASYEGGDMIYTAGRYRTCWPHDSARAKLPEVTFGDEPEWCQMQPERPPDSGSSLVTLW